MANAPKRNREQAVFEVYKKFVEGRSKRKPPSQITRRYLRINRQDSRAEFTKQNSCIVLDFPKSCQPRVTPW